MRRQHQLELIVGLFVLAGFLSLLILGLRVSSMSSLFHENTYEVTAQFDNIGDLKVRAPVTIAGVKVGEVSRIDLDNKNFKALVHLNLYKDKGQIPADSSASILTQGLLGGNYISLAPGYSDEDEGESFLKEGSRVDDTHPAIVLEELIGQFMYSMNKDSAKSTH